MIWDSDEMFGTVAFRNFGDANEGNQWKHLIREREGWVVNSNNRTAAAEDRDILKYNMERNQRSTPTLSNICLYENIGSSIKINTQVFGILIHIMD